MADEHTTVAWGIVREVVVTALSWVLVTTGLYLLASMSPSGPGSALREQSRAFRGGREAVGLGEWLGSYATMDYGWSIVRSQPVSEAIFASLQYTVPFVAMVLLAGVVLGGLAAVAVRRAEGTVPEPAVTGAASVVASVPPVVWLAVVATFAVVTGAVPLFFRATVARQGGATGQLLLRLLTAVAVAVPFVGMFARRVQRTRSSAWRRRGTRVQVASLEPWLYATYLFGGVVVANQIFAVPGIGLLWYNAFVRQDLPLLFGITGFLATVFVLLGFVRNLAWVAGDALNVTAADDRATGPGSAPDGGDPAGSVPDGITGDDDSGDGKSEGGDRSRTATPDRGGSPPGRDEIGDAIAGQRAVLVGGAGFALVLVAGLLGSAVLSLPGGFELERAGPFAGFGLATLLHTFGSLAVVLLVAVVVAVVFGVARGLVAGAVGGPVATLLRLPSDVTLVVPLLVLAAAVRYVFGAGGGRTGFEVLMGVLGGVVLSAYGFRVARAAAADWRAAGAGRAGAVRAATVRSLGRTLAYAPPVGFVAVEMNYLGFGTRTAVPATVRMADAMAGLMEATLLAQVGALVFLALAFGLPALCCYLAGDGLEAAADELRAR